MMRLREHGIYTWAQERVDATLDYDEKGVPGALRISPHTYTTEQEIDRTLELLSEWTAH